MTPLGWGGLVLEFASLGLLWWAVFARDMLYCPRTAEYSVLLGAAGVLVGFLLAQFCG